MNKGGKTNKIWTTKTIASFMLLSVFAIAGIMLITAPHRTRQQFFAAQSLLMIEIYTGDTYITRNGDQETTDYAVSYNTYREMYPEIVLTDRVFDIVEQTPVEPLPRRRPTLLENVYGIGILTIESIDLYLPVADGVDEQTLRVAVGRVPQTAQIGEIGNAVIAGHRNYTHGQMFNRLGEIRLGDIIHYRSKSGEKMQFEVFEIAIIEPGNQITFVQPINTSIITLYTCEPIRVASHRLIVRAQLIEEGDLND